MSRRDKGNVCVTGFPFAAKNECFPNQIVADVTRLRAHFTGYLRDDIERYDLPLRKEQHAEPLSDPPARFVELRADIEALTGNAPGPLEGKLASLEAVDAALAALVAKRATSAGACARTPSSTSA